MRHNDKMRYVPLHVHSQYSILDSTLSMEAIAARAKAYNLSAVGLSDFGNMYGAVEFIRG